jgi:hypothetical protein
MPMLTLPPQDLKPAIGNERNDHLSLRPTIPVRTVADLVSEVVLRGRSIRTQTAYRVDLHDFLLWLLGREVTIPSDLAALPSDAPAAQALNAAMAAL